VFTAAVKPFIGARRLLATAKKYLGVAPQSAKEGDQVWTLPGATLLYIFRPISTKGEFKLIGDAYEHGAVKDESVRHGLQLREVILM
jgi:hypothetical protein